MTMWYYKIEDGVVVQKQPRPRDGFVEGPANVYPGYLYDGETFTEPPLPDPVDMPYRVYRSTFIMRMEEDEVVLLEDVLNEHENAKLRQMFYAVEYLQSDDALFAYLHWIVATTLGEDEPDFDRADELLAPEGAL